jgi:hypothetical protein
MNRPPDNALPLNEWLESFDQFAGPLQRGEFDLTPILRARYGNLLREGIFSIKLFAEHRRLILIAFESGITKPIIIDFSETSIEESADSELDALSFLDGLFFYGFDIQAPDCHASIDERNTWYNAMLPHFLTLCDSHESAEVLNVFTPQYIAMLKRVKTRWSYAMEQKQERIYLEYATKFYESSAHFLAQHIQKDIRSKLLKQLADQIKEEESSGILGSELETYWDELGVIAYEGGANLLYDTLAFQLDMQVSTAIDGLSEAEQFALWACSDEAGEWFGKDADYYRNYPRNAVEVKKDFTYTIENIRNELLGMAMNSLSPAAQAYLDF